MEQEDIREKILQGYERLAFGSTADAVRLLFVEDISRQALRNMDLFAVAEIRKTAGWRSNSLTAYRPCSAWRPWAAAILPQGFTKPCRTRLCG